MESQHRESRREALARVKDSLEECLIILDGFGPSIAGAHVEAAIGALATEVEAHE